MEGRTYRALDKLCSFVAAFIGQTTGHKKTVHMTAMDTLYSETVVDMIQSMKQQTRSERKFHRIEIRVQKRKRLSSETFDKHHGTCLYILKYHILRYIVNDIQYFGMLDRLDSISAEDINTHVNRAYRRTS